MMIRVSRYRAARAGAPGATINRIQVVLALAVIAICVILFAVGLVAGAWKLVKGRNSNGLVSLSLVLS